MWFVDQPEQADFKVWSALGIAVLGIGLVLAAHLGMAPEPLAVLME
ncbi:hypothetical protein [Brevundimonas sp.]